jgi:fatty acid desaturase
MANETRTDGPPETENPLHRLTPEQIETLGREFDELHDRVRANLGDRDARYIRGIIALQRRLALYGRVLLIPSRFWPAWVAGTGMLSTAKILENMEIGHNVLHGQWDWMNDPVINSTTWDWDTASTAEAWKHSHNYIHHTFTNIRGKDKDLGYEVMRIDPHQRWHPVYLLQPIYNVVLMLAFEWGVAVHDMDFDAIRAGEKGRDEIVKDLEGIWGKARQQIVKDYIAWPLLSALLMAGLELAITTLEPDRNAPTTLRGRAQQQATRIARRIRRRGRRRGRRLDPRLRRALAAGRKTYRATLLADLAANVIRNVWSNAIIFCGHFPDQTYTFSQDEVENESRGARYVRQLIGAANIEGGPFFHVMSGNLGYQVEHHLFPDMPSTRYGEIAPQVREICRRYGLPYNSGPFLRQWSMVQRTILRLAFPGGKARPKPGPYEGPIVKTSGERDLLDAAAVASNGGHGRPA